MLHNLAYEETGIHGFFDCSLQPAGRPPSAASGSTVCVWYGDWVGPHTVPLTPQYIRSGADNLGYSHTMHPYTLVHDLNCVCQENRCFQRKEHLEYRESPFDKGSTYGIVSSYSSRCIAPERSSEFPKSTKRCRVCMHGPTAMQDVTAGQRGHGVASAVLG